MCVIYILHHMSTHHDLDHHIEPTHPFIASQPFPQRVGGGSLA